MGYAKLIVSYERQLSTSFLFLIFPNRKPLGNRKSSIEKSGINLTKRVGKIGKEKKGKKKIIITSEDGPVESSFPRQLFEKNQPPLLNRAISHLLPPCSFNFPSFNDPPRRGIDK